MLSPTTSFSCRPETMEFRPESRSSLYFNRYLCGIRCYVPDVCVLRQLDHNAIDEMVLYRNTCIGFPWNRHRIDEDRVKRMHQLCDLLLASTDPFKKICQIDYLYLYSNDPVFLTTVISQTNVVCLWAGKVTLDRPAGVVIKKRSRYGFRTFFRERYLDPRESQTLKNFLESNADRYRPSQSLQQHIFKSRQHYIRNYYFVDHYDQGDLILLSLAVPGLIRKTMPIQTK
jgi:hypothetical protein